MKILLIFLATFLNITLLYLGQYYPFIIGLFLWFTLLFYSPRKKNTKSKKNETSKDEIDINPDNLKIYEFLMILYVFEDNLEFLKKTNVWQKINIKYDDYIIKDALKTNKDNQFSLFKKYLLKSKDNQKFYFLYELINLRHDAEFYITDKQNDSIIKLINFFDIDFLKRRELINKAYYYLLKEEPFNERVKRNAKKIHENIKCNIEKQEQERILKALSLFQFSSTNDVTPEILKKRYKVMLSKKHPDKHVNISQEEKKKLEKEFIELQENYNFIQEKLFY